MRSPEVLEREEVAPVSAAVMVGLDRAAGTYVVITRIRVKGGDASI